MLRQARASKTPLGKVIGPILDSGSLVNDETMIRIVEDRIANSDCDRGFILDGFPRTIPQADALASMLAKRPLSAAVLLEVERGELVSRLNNRFMELENPRAEDHPDAIPKRLDIYEDVTRPLIDFYDNRDLLVRIDGLGTPEAVFQQIVTNLDQTPA